jgi:uncharacterized protein
MNSSVRIYRQEATGVRFTSFTVKVKETDLWVAVNPKVYSKDLVSVTEAAVLKIRRPLEQYLALNPYLRATLEPCLIEPGAPPIVINMVRAANKTGVGPMAAVAGAVAEEVGLLLLKQTGEVIVENGGDIFLQVNEPVAVGIFAGSSCLSGKLVLQISPDQTPLGICTSSGTVGPSVSFGCADAAIAIAPSVPLADAAATALGNRVKTKTDLQEAIDFARQVEGLTGALLIIGEKIAAWGDIKLQPLHK